MAGNDMRVGLVGIGFMGWIHFLAYQRSDVASIAAICTRDSKKAKGDWTSIKGNFGPPGSHVDLSGIKVYDHWEELVRSDEIDAIDICLPPSMHRDVAIAALENGKHVLCEKPIALHEADCDAMMQAAMNAQRQLAVAHVLPYMGPFEYALQKARSKEFGAVRSVHLKRIISDPSWIPDFYNPNTVGGPMIDLHIHDAHFLQLLCGMPTEVTACGWQRDNVTQYAQMLYRFADPSQVVTCASGVGTSNARGFTHGFEIQFEQAVLTFEFAAHSSGSDALGLLQYRGDAETQQVALPAKDDIDGFVGEIADFVRLVRGEEDTSNPLKAEYASNAVRICKAVEQAVATRRAVKL